MADVCVMQTRRGRVKLVHSDYQHTKHTKTIQMVWLLGGAAQDHVQLVWEHSWDRTIATLSFWVVTAISVIQWWLMPFKIITRWRNMSNNRRNPCHPSSTGSSCFKLHWKLWHWYQVKRLSDVLFNINALKCDLHYLLQLPISTYAIPNSSTCQQLFFVGRCGARRWQNVIVCKRLLSKFALWSTISFADGMFWMVPRIFTQLFIVNFKYHGKLLPVVYLLVRKKTQSVYKHIL